MKRIILVCLLSIIALNLKSQDTYLAGRITGFDNRHLNTDIERPLDIIKLKGYIVLDKESLVIHKERRKDGYLHYRILSIEKKTVLESEINYILRMKDSIEEDVEGSLKILNNGNWEIYITDKQFQWYFSGIPLKNWLMK